MWRASLVAASLAGCTFDYSALQGSAGAPDDYLSYTGVVDPCPSRWRHVFSATFDDPEEDLDDAWIPPGTADWHIDEDGRLAVTLAGGDYWTTHLVARDLDVEDVWMRVDVEASMDNYAQLHARIDAEAPDASFYALRTRPDLAGVGLYRQIQAADAPDPDEELYFSSALSEGTFYRHVLSARTGPAGDVVVKGGIYRIVESGAPTVWESVVTHMYPEDQAIGAGSIGLSGWQNLLRFDNVHVFSCAR